MNNYTGRSMVELRQALLDKIPELTSKWTNYNESDLGVAFIELIVGVSDMLGFYLDKQTLETYLETVKQRKNAKAILNSLNYKLHMRKSNIATATIELPTPFEENLVIPRYTQLTTKSSNSKQLYYVTSEEVILRAGESRIDVTLLQGRHYIAEMKVNDLKSTRILLKTDNIAMNSVKLTINGEEWEEIDDIILDDSGTKKFSVHEDNDDKAYIQLPLDYIKLLPRNSESPVKVEYLETLGAEGVIKKGTMLAIASSIVVNNVDFSKQFLVTTTSIASGGCERESIERARVQAPKKWRTMNYAVTLEDFNVLANNYAGVNKALAVDWTIEDGAYVNVPYYVKVFVLPESYSPNHSTEESKVSEKFLSEIKSYLEANKLVSTMVEVSEPEFVPMDISITVNHRYPEAKILAIKDEIIEKIKEFTSPNNVTFGRGVKYSNIISKLESDFDLIRFIELTKVSSTSLKLNQLPEWRNIEVTMVRSDY